jgi:septal ring factor EnvC (AmiA/AmiB activator)
MEQRRLNMELDVIMQYILSLVPSFTAVIGMVVCIIVGINKIRKSSAEAEKAVKDIRNENFVLRLNLKEYDTDFKAMHNKISEMEAKLRKISARMDHVYIVDKEEKKEE